MWQIPSTAASISRLKAGDTGRVFYKNFFEKRVKFPKFEKKHNKQFIRFSQGFKVEGDFVYLPKIGW